MASTLRALLEEGLQNIAFKEDGVADVIVSTDDIEQKMAAIHRALVAHEALNTMLAACNTHEKTSFLRAILAAKVHHLISEREARWLKSFNKSANTAKHSISTSLG